MADLMIKEISEFIEDKKDKSKVIFCDIDGKETEIVLEGSGKIRIPVEV